MSRISIFTGFERSSNERVQLTAFGDGVGKDKARA